MTDLKNTVAAIVMMTVLTVGTTFANTGIIIAKVDNEPCKEESTDMKFDFGRIGIIIATVGIIIAGADGDPNDTCGIIIAG